MIYNTFYLWFIQQLENKCPPPQTDWKDFQNKNTNVQTKTNASTGILHITVLHLIGRNAPMQGHKLIIRLSMTVMNPRTVLPEIFCLCKDRNLPEVKKEWKNKVYIWIFYQLLFCLLWKEWRMDQVFYKDRGNVILNTTEWREFCMILNRWTPPNKWIKTDFFEFVLYPSFHLSIKK